MLIRNSRGVIEEFDDDDIEIVNGRAVLRDGRTYRAPVQFMDSRGQDDWPRHAPGFASMSDADTVADEADRQNAEDAREQWLKELEDAWKQPAAPPANDDRNLDAAVEARQQWIDEMTNAWMK